MLPWQNKTVQFVGEGAFSLADLQRSLSVLSIADTLPTPTLHTIGLPNMPARPRPPPPPPPPQPPPPGLPSASSHSARTLLHKHLIHGVVGAQFFIFSSMQTRAAQPAQPAVQHLSCGASVRPQRVQRLCGAPVCSACSTAAS